MNYLLISGNKLRLVMNLSFGDESIPGFFYLDVAGGIEQSTSLNNSKIAIQLATSDYRVFSRNATLIYKDIRGSVINLTANASIENIQLAWLPEIPESLENPTGIHYLLNITDITHPEEPVECSDCHYFTDNHFTFVPNFEQICHAFRFTVMQGCSMDNNYYNETSLPENTLTSVDASLVKPDTTHPVTGLIATANDTFIQLDWESSEVTRYLVSVSNITETPAIVSSPYYTYFPESQDCQWYEFVVKPHECFNATDPDTSRSKAASVRVAYPNISPVSLQLSGEEVLVDWLSGNSDLAVIASLRNGSKTLMTHTGTLPFSYVATGCAWYNLNVTVSPAQCEGEPDFTQSASIGFTILCPTTPTEPETEVTGESSGTLAMYPSLLAVVAFIPVLKWLY